MLCIILSQIQRLFKFFLTYNCKRNLINLSGDVYLCSREAIASEIFDAPEKADWKQCVVSKEEEIKYVKEFRQLFEPFDFTLTQ